MSNQKKILFLINSEYGPASPVLAIALELVVQGFEVHVASFITNKELGPSLTKRVDDLNNGYSHVEQFGAKVAMSKCKTLVDILSIHEPDYMNTSTELASIIQDTKPDVVVVDYLCVEAREAVKVLALTNYVVLSHSSSKSIMTGGRTGYWMWNFPLGLTGFRFPLPWYMKPLNLSLATYGMIAVLNTPSFKQILRLQSDRTFKGKLPFITEVYSDTVKYVVPSAQEIDFPYSKVPANITSCGPIQLPIRPLSATDPDLELWLKARPTVMMNLGSGYITSKAQAESIANGFLTLLHRLPDIQVLWKLAVKPGKDAKARAILSSYIEKGSVKIVDWLQLEPSSILHSGLVKCYVHSGGPSSYYEAIGAGVPHIAIHCWFDLFDFTTRIEYLGVGPWGNRHARSKGDFVNAQEFSDAISTIMDPNNAKGSKMIAKAKELGKIAKEYGGSKKAAEKIMWVAEIGGYEYKEGHGTGFLC